MLAKKRQIEKKQKTPPAELLETHRAERESLLSIESAKKKLETEKQNMIEKIGRDIGLLKQIEKEKSK